MMKKQSILSALFPLKITPLFLLISTLIIGGQSAEAADPFRTTNPRPIGEKTAAAFQAWFQEGNYQQAAQYLQQAEIAESQEPLVFAMKASLAYLQEDWQALSNYAKKTREAATNLKATEPLRSNLYMAVSIFLEGAVTVAQEPDIMRAAPAAMNKLRTVFQYLNAANAIDPNDPELNLIQGYMDLMLATNLPFSNPNDAIQRLQNKAQPAYLVNRGIALGYRDLDQPEQSLNFALKALEQTPNNPELLYLVAQIYVIQGRRQNSVELFKKAQSYFEAALAKSSQLPKETFLQIFLEHCKNLDQIDGRNRACRGQRENLERNLNGNWGPATPPSL